MVAPNTYFSIIIIVVFLTYRYVHQFTCTEQKAILKNCGSTVWNLLQITLLAFGIWRFGKYVDPC
jgi:hypothetical protein